MLFFRFAIRLPLVPKISLSALTERKIGMFPYIYIGQLKISLYYSAMVLGYILMIVVMLLKKRRERCGLSRLGAVAFATVVLIFGLVGCKLLYILENISWIQKNGFTLGGFSFYGAVFLMPLVMPLVGKLFKLHWRDTLDSSAICILTMLGTIRLGCYLNGCCGGSVFHIGDYYFTFPTQLIECICDCAFLYALLKWEEKGTARGFLYPRFLLLYGGARFFIEFLRNTPKDWLYLSHAQWFSAGALLVGIAFEIVHRYSRDKSTKE